VDRLEVLAFVLLVTLPFGFYRAYTRRFSARWFLALHLPVPLVFLARFEAHLPYTFIPFTCLAFFAGQMLGARAGRWWIRRRSPARGPGDPVAGPAADAAGGSAADAAGPPPEPDVPGLAIPDRHD
jgi:hypothetical protein